MAAKTPCTDCDKKFWKKDMLFGPDPYNQDIRGDDTPVWLCDDCYNIAVGEI